MMGHRNDVSSWISAVDVLILTSTYEGQGLVLIEAMAAGVPVIASDVGGVSEIVNHEVNGLLVKAKDPQSLYDSITRLFNDNHLRQSIIKNALDTYPRYRPENICEMLENIYSSCSNVQKHIN
jgi:glycosyltransferase involved in cell wall biosynthesis